MSAGLCVVMEFKQVTLQFATNTAMIDVYTLRREGTDKVK